MNVDNSSCENIFLFIDNKHIAVKDFAVAMHTLWLSLEASFLKWQYFGLYLPNGLERKTF